VCCLALQRSTPCCDVAVTITLSKLELDATCCNAHTKFAMVGLFVAVVTPSQIVVTATAAVAHTPKSLKSQHALAPPATEISCCAVLASFGLCTTVRTQTRYSEYSHGALGFKPMRTLQEPLAPVSPMLSSHMGHSEYSHQILGVLWVLTLGRFECSHGVIRVFTLESLSTHSEVL
jgi:hypothetical protein